MIEDPIVQKWVVYGATTTIGQLLHAVKQKGDGEVDTIFDWFHSNPWRSAGAFVANFVTVLIAIQMGIPDALDIKSNVMIGLLTGLGVDAATNKAKRTEWTAVERKAERAKEDR